MTTVPRRIPRASNTARPRSCNAWASREYSHVFSKNGATVCGSDRRSSRQIDIDPEVSVVRSIADKELHIYTDVGRVCRPLLIVDAADGRQALRLQKRHVKSLLQKEITWTQLLMEGA